MSEPWVQDEIPTFDDLAAICYNTLGDWIGMSNIGFTIAYSPDIYKYGLGDHAKIPLYSKNLNLEGFRVTGGLISGTMTVVGLGLELGNTASADNGNTGKQRLQKIAIQTTSAAANITVGAAGVIVAGGGSVGSLGTASIPSCIAGAAIITFGTTAVSKWEDDMYDRLGIAD